jgi:HlyD family secretion protein
MNEHVEPVAERVAVAKPEAIMVSAPAKPSPRPRWRRQRLLSLAIVVLVLTVGAAWWKMRSGDQLSYVTATVDRGAVTKTVTATGTVNPILTVTVGSYVSGVVQAVPCDFNTKVTKGEVCARIDPRPFQSLVDQAQADVDLAKAQLLKDQANVTYTKLSSDRNAKLVSQQAVTQDAADVAMSVYNQAQAQIQVDNASVEQKEAALDAAKINLAYTDILSPVDGTVVSRNVTAGQTVASSLQTPTLFLIAQDLASMEVDNNISESDIGAVKAGEKATFSVDAYPGRNFEGVVQAVRLAPQSVQNVVTYDVIVNVSNPDLALMPGMTASTKVVVDSRVDAVRIPTQALRYRPAGLALTSRAGVRPPGTPPRQSGGSLKSAGSGMAGTTGQVFVLRNGKPVFVSVQIGLDDGSFTEILGGSIQTGDQVITGESSDGATQPTQSTAPRLRL